MKRIVSFLIAAILGCGCGKAPSMKNDVSVDAGDSNNIEISEEVSQDAGETEIGEEVDVHASVDATNASDGEEVEEPEASEPKTLPEQFVEAGGQSLCEGLIYQLYPEWRPSSCDIRRDERRAEVCRRRLTPVTRYVRDICKANIEESLRWNMDPVLGIADMMQESGLGRRYYDREAYVYRINTDICEMFLSTSRINCGLTGFPPCQRVLDSSRRAKWACWTYGDNARENCQGVYELAVESGGVKIDTCLAGEFGVFQLLPANYRKGTVVAATGEVLQGERNDIERRLLHDVTLQVQLGFQELAEHRSLAPTPRQEDWTDWLPIYNIGKDCRLPNHNCTERQYQHWNTYLWNISTHYIKACEGYFHDEEGQVILIKNVWPECQRIEAFRDRLRGRDD